MSPDQQQLAPEVLPLQPVLEMLRRARTRIAAPEQWVRGTAAKDKDDTHVIASSEKACKFCMLGALWAERSTRGVGEKFRALSNIVSNAEIQLAASLAALHTAYYMSSPDDIADFNDHYTTTHDMVLAVYDHAIQALLDLGVPE